MGSFTTMNSRLWNMTRVTVREGEERLLDRELGMMASLTHPQLLLLMGHCPATERENLILVFEPVLLGSLYLCLHSQDHQLTVLGGVDILLQVTDGLMFLAGKGLVHRAVTSHAVQMVSRRVAKLGMLEMTVREGDVVARPADTGWQCLYNWLSPEVLVREKCVARQASDVYSLCCLIWELCMGQVPWGDQALDHIHRGHNIESLTEATGLWACLTNPSPRE
jgi:serine/threonine protein kinase